MSNSKKENLFARLAMQNARAVQQDEEPVAAVPASEPAPSPAPIPDKPKPAAQKPKARPAVGRRANPDYCQANAYVLKSVRRDVERALLDIDGLDYSELVEELLSKWLKSKRVSG